jgi:non-homologous end joining protein Ku
MAQYISTTIITGFDEQKEPLPEGLLGTTLRYPYEVRNATDYFGDLPELTV